MTAEPVPRVLARALRWCWDGELGPWQRALVLAAWAVVVGACLAQHEPWRDEADPWLFARDARPALDDLTRFTRCVGSPGLWHALLVPLARSGLPYGSMLALHGLLAAAAVALLVWRSPLPTVLRVALPFSYYFGFEYAVVARSYVLTALLALVAAALHRTRLERPAVYGLVIGLLANTNPHGTFMALALGCGFAFDVLRARRARAWSGLVLALALGLAAAWQLWPHPDGQLLPAPGRPVVFVGAALGSAFVPLQDGQLRILAVLPGLAVLLLVVWAASSDRAVLLSLTLGLAGLFFVFAFVYSGGPRHHGLIQVLLLWAVWVLRDAPLDPAKPAAHQRDHLLRLATIAWVVALAWSTPVAARTWSRELRDPFSGSAEAAAYLTAHGLDRPPLAAHPPGQGCALLPYLRTPSFLYVGQGTAGSHLTWDRAYHHAQHEVGVPEAAAIAARELPPGACLVLNQPLAAPGTLGWELVFATTRPALKVDENYWIYRRRS